MSQLKQRKLKRILKFEEQHLESLLIELRQTQSLLDEQASLHSQLSRNIAEQIENLPGEALSLFHLEQKKKWTLRSTESLRHIETKMEETRRQKELQLEEVLAKRAKVKGWQRLLEKLDKQLLEDQQKTEMVSLDDAHLQKLNRGT